ncbi:arginine-ornithine antiporter [Macrococcoides caseolyticum]|uniref:arginine-ornithine antiporter n=1 Tax=Macrococcoides caseolyticum TaxID=69966 RepID=UPI002D805E06|nr:arginine-ornithine antiporter [Macrococcus caseolyticus]MCE4956625.1 arginine-ornithine antiporter [Macrococcus caseolyticus]
MLRNDKKLSLFALVAMVIGSMIGGGAFNLISDMGSNSGGLSIIIGWIITGIGMIMLGLSLQNLTRVRPDLDGGIYNYAKAGFGDYMGFNAAWGYWFSTLLGNVAYGTLLMSALGTFFPMFEGGHNVPSIIFASILLWGVFLLISNGVKNAAFVNMIVTIAKLIPIFFFIITMIVVFNFDTFMTGFYGMTEHGQKEFNFFDTMAQVKSTMIVTVWAFLGVEGAVVFSSRAKKRSDVGKATIIGLVSVLIIYIMITLLAQGVIIQNKIDELSNPSMAAVMEHIVGPWGAHFINIGLMISVMGAWLGWSLLAAEVPNLAAKDDIFPEWFGRGNKNDAPVNSMLITFLIVQAFFISLLFTDKAYKFAFSLSSSAVLLPYAFSSFYQLKYSVQHQLSTTQKVIGSIASLYSVWLIFAAGMEYLLLTMMLFFPGIFVYRRVQKTHNRNITNVDKVVFGVLSIFTMIGVYFILSGNVTVF